MVILHVRLHLIGKGYLLEQLKAQAQDYHLEDCVIFYGALSQQAIKHRYEEADVFILPGRFEAETGRAETQGLVIQEAQAMELPVVVSDAGGMKYGLIPNESGYVVEEEKLEGFVEAVEILILNAGLKVRMGKRGRTFIEENYENKILLKKLLKIYKGL